MSELNLLLSSMAASILISLLMWFWMRLPLQQLLDQLCGRPGGTLFWSRYTLLMLLIAPLSLTVFFSPDAQLNDADALRRIFLTLLLGNFVAFALVGRSLFKTVRQASQSDTLQERN